MPGQQRQGIEREASGRLDFAWIRLKAWTASQQKLVAIAHQHHHCGRDALRAAAEAKIPLLTALARITCDPAAILGINAGALAVDVCIFDADEPWQVSAKALRSEGKNTPFIGYEMAGRVRQTLVGGRLVFEAGD